MVVRIIDFLISLFSVLAILSNSLASPSTLISPLLAALLCFETAVSNGRLRTLETSKHTFFSHYVVVKIDLTEKRYKFVRWAHVMHFT